MIIITAAIATTTPLQHLLVRENGKQGKRVHLGTGVIVWTNQTYSLIDAIGVNPSGQVTRWTTQLTLKQLNQS